MRIVRCASSFRSTFVSPCRSRAPIPSLDLTSDGRQVGDLQGRAGLQEEEGGALKKIHETSVKMLTEEHAATMAAKDRAHATAVQQVAFR